MSYGANAKLAIMRQSAEGTYTTGAVNSYHPLAFTSNDVGLEIQEQISENLTGRFEEGASYAGPSNIAGTIEMELTPRSIGAAMAMVINQPVSVSSDSLRTLTYLPNTAEFSATLVKNPYSIYWQLADASSAEFFYDCQAGQLEFSIAQGAFLRGRMAVVGGRRLSGGVGSLNLVPDAADAQKVFPWNVASISYAGTGLSNMSEVTISINENIEQIFALNGTLFPYKYARGGFREITVNGTFYMSDRTFNNAGCAAIQDHAIQAGRVGSRRSGRAVHWQGQVRFHEFVRVPGDSHDHLGKRLLTFRSLLHHTGDYNAERLFEKDPEDHSVRRLRGSRRDGQFAIRRLAALRCHRVHASRAAQ
jgi:hypothetical protein